MGIVVLALLLITGAQAQDQQKQLKSTGSCGRCHVASVLEWSVSKHEKSGTGCDACHGVSKGHIIDERNNIKPERIPRGAAIVTLCATCHTDGCPKSKEKASCQNCHHAHALLNPNSGKAQQDARLNEVSNVWDAWTKAMEEGEGLYKQGSWVPARNAFQRAAAQRPEDNRSKARIAACERRINPKLAGFEIIGSDFDPETGLPLRVRTIGSGIEMVLVPGGDADIGSDALKNAAPAHTVNVGAFYLAKYELMQAQWQKLMGTNPSESQGDKLPVGNISWNDAQEFVKKLNAATAGAGFRLPTEAEWEYAARAGQKFEQGTLTRVAWFRDSPDPKATQPVGTREPNRWGFYDMIGNVWEWCSSANRPIRLMPQTAGRALRLLRRAFYAEAVTPIRRACLTRRCATRRGPRGATSGTACASRAVCPVLRVGCHRLLS